MLERLSAYIGSDVKRSASMFVVLLVALVVALSALVWTLADFNWSTSPKYTSEVTPLTHASTGITWTKDLNESIGGDCKYSNIYFTWGNQSGRLSGSVAYNSTQENLSLGVRKSVIMHCGSETLYGGPTVDLYLSLTDISGDGNFSWGDSIEFTASPIPNRWVAEEDVMTVALIYIGNGFRVGLGEYSYVIHDGKFYSWHSEVLDWSTPWYDSWT